MAPPNSVECTYMAYSTNPNLPRVRMQAVMLVRQGWSIRSVARHMGFHHTAVMKWMKKAEPLRDGEVIPTESSRPHSYPNELPQSIVDKIVKVRLRRNRCAEVVYQEMINQGYSVCLSSVKRTLEREGLIRKRSPWKRWHFEQERPLALKPGDLVQIDTIHLIPGALYIYTLIDIFSRWTQARVSERINTRRSLLFTIDSEKTFAFRFNMLQSDNGQEFSTWFTEHIQKRDIAHRHSRVRKPTDNGYVERFNRTLKEECLKDIPKTMRAYKKVIPEYIHYYNHERLHLGLNLKTPMQVVTSS